MPGIKRLILSILFALFAGKASAQQAFSFCAIPLYETIEVELLGCDKAVLDCYNLYGYNYYKNGDTLYGEFIVPKDEDTFKNKLIVPVRLGRVKEFSIGTPKGCRKLAVDEGIQLKYTDQDETVFLNFDPGMPDPVFIPCK
ncbi:MAG: hypothetical protein H6550_12850 [Chitinophagales bacterium]|nr:hypothetical protein [Chitinophagales bacterium]